MTYFKSKSVNMNTNKNKNSKSEDHFWLVITPLLQAKSGLRMLIRDCLDGELAYHGQSVTGTNLQSHKSKFRHFFRIINRPNKGDARQPSMMGSKKRHIRSFSSNRPTLIDFWPIKVSLIREEKRGAELGPIFIVRLLNRALEQIWDHIWLVITHLL